MAEEIKPRTSTLNGRLWGARARDWADVQEGVVRPVYEAVFERTRVGVGVRYLDVGCGSGMAARLAAERGAQVSGIDAAEGLLAIARSRLLNPPMLEVARGKFRSDEMVEFQAVDATALPFPDASFDTVVCQFGIMFFPDKDKGHREAHRVVASGGRYLFSVWDSHRYNPIGPLITEILEGFFPHDPPQFYHVPFSYYRIDPIKESLDAAGFTDLTIAVLREIKIIPDVPTYARAVVLGNPLIDQIRARGGVDPERVIDALTKALPREFGTDPTRIPLQAIVFEAKSR
jgi:SAM-dependent methyltransferase